RDRAPPLGRSGEGDPGLRADAGGDVPGDGIRASFMTRIAALSAAVAAVGAAAGAMHYAGSAPTAVFVLSGAALGGLAWIIGVATESVGARFGPAVTGVL